VRPSLSSGFGNLSDPASEAERRIAWLRLIAVPLIIAAATLPHPHPERDAFFVAATVVGAYALGALAWVHARPVTRTSAPSSAPSVPGSMTVSPIPVSPPTITPPSDPLE